jgi:hypothetical protein
MGHGDNGGGTMVEASIVNFMDSSCERPGGMTAEA